AAMGKFNEELVKAGVMLAGEGLHPTSKGAKIRILNGKATVTDGPFTEAKEMVGGYAVYELRSKEEAVEAARRFMQLHADLWPGVEAVCEVRQIAGPDDFPEP
ncbi:MAG: YciI family protein, partial [Pseudonocardiales bacterium]